MSAIDKVSLTYHDSRNRGVITMNIQTVGGRVVSVAMTPQDAAAFADRLLTAVRAEGYTLSARKLVER